MVGAFTIQPASRSLRLRWDLRIQRPEEWKAYNEAPQMLPSGSQRRTIPIIQIVMNTGNLFVPSRKPDAIWANSTVAAFCKSLLNGTK